MIQIYKREAGRVVPVSEAEGSCWIDSRNTTKEEFSLFETDYGILSDHLQDILDIDEQPRVEKEDDYTMVIMRLPAHDPAQDVAYFTVPVGIFIFSERIVTICQSDSEALSGLVTNRVRDFDVRNRSAFVLRLLGRAAMVYLRYLKEINRRTSAIELELQRSVKNNELVQLLSLQKSLVYFTTSLRANEIMMEKVKADKALRFREEESELYEDVMTDNRQAIEMANIYSDILTGMMDAFASVISNNLNMVMKRLTIISIVLMVPTLFVSIFGMNVDIPFQQSPWSFAVIMGLSALTAAASTLLLRDQRKPASIAENRARLLLRKPRRKARQKKGLLEKK